MSGGPPLLTLFGQVGTWKTDLSQVAVAELVRKERQVDYQAWGDWGPRKMDELVNVR